MLEHLEPVVISADRWALWEARARSFDLIDGMTLATEIAAARADPTRHNLGRVCNLARWMADRHDSPVARALATPT